MHSMIRKIPLAGLLIAAAPAFAQGTTDIITGAGFGGGPHVKVLSGRDGQFAREIQAYNPSFTGGVRVAAGDVTGDGTPDIVVAAGPGVRGGQVRVFDGASESIWIDFTPYADDRRFTGGVFVAAGDIDGDGAVEIITAPGRGGGPHVRVFSGSSGALLTEFSAYDAQFTGGVHIATGDVTGDGLADIITAPASGGDGQVRVFDALGNQSAALYPYGRGFTGGVFVAAGDVSGDHAADIITAPVGLAGPNIRVFDMDRGKMTLSFFAYSPQFLGGVRVATGDVNGDGLMDIITAPGHGGGPHVKVFDGIGGWIINEFFVDGVDGDGLFVAGLQGSGAVDGGLLSPP